MGELSQDIIEQMRFKAKIAEAIDLKTEEMIKWTKEHPNKKKVYNSWQTVMENVEWEECMRSRK